MLLSLRPVIVAASTVCPASSAEICECRSAQLSVVTAERLSRCHRRYRKGEEWRRLARQTQFWDESAVQRVNSVDHHVVIEILTSFDNHS
jgi:hypothetical protein